MQSSRSRPLKDLDLGPMRGADGPEGADGGVGFPRGAGAKNTPSLGGSFCPFRPEHLQCVEDCGPDQCAKLTHGLGASIPNELYRVEVRMLRHSGTYFFSKMIPSQPWGRFVLPRLVRSYPHNPARTSLERRDILPAHPRQDQTLLPSPASRIRDPCPPKANPCTPSSMAWDRMDHIKRVTFASDSARSLRSSGRSLSIPDSGGRGIYTRTAAPWRAYPPDTIPPFKPRLILAASKSLREPYCASATAHDIALRSLDRKSLVLPAFLAGLVSMSRLR